MKKFLSILTEYFLGASGRKRIQHKNMLRCFHVSTNESLWGLTFYVTWRCPDVSLWFEVESTCPSGSDLWVSSEYLRYTLVWELKAWVQTVPPSPENKEKHLQEPSTEITQIPKITLLHAQTFLPIKLPKKSCVSKTSHTRLCGLFTPPSSAPLPEFWKLEGPAQCPSCSKD